MPTIFLQAMARLLKQACLREAKRGPRRLMAPAYAPNSCRVAVIDTLAAARRAFCRRVDDAAPKKTHVVALVGQNGFSLAGDGVNVGTRTPLLRCTPG